MLTSFWKMWKLIHLSIISFLIHRKKTTAILTFCLSFSVTLFGLNFRYVTSTIARELVNCSKYNRQTETHHRNTIPRCNEHLRTSLIFINFEQRMHVVAMGLAVSEQEWLVGCWLSVPLHIFIKFLHMPEFATQMKRMEGRMAVENYIATDTNVARTHKPTHNRSSVDASICCNQHEWFMVRHIGSNACVDRFAVFVYWSCVITLNSCLPFQLASWLLFSVAASLPPFFVPITLL